MEEKEKKDLLLCMTEITLITNVENAVSPLQGNEKSTVYLQANVHPTLCYVRVTTTYLSSRSTPA